MWKVVFSNNNLTQFQSSLSRILNLMKPLSVEIGDYLDTYTAKVTLEYEGHHEENPMTILQESTSLEEAFCATCDVFAYDLDENSNTTKCYMFKKPKLYTVYPYPDRINVEIEFGELYGGPNIDKKCEEIEKLRYYATMLRKLMKEEFDKNSKEEVDNMKHFSECIGECVTCASHGHCSAGIGDDAYIVADKAELIRRLKNDNLSEHNKNEIKRVLIDEYHYDGDLNVSLNSESMVELARNSLPSSWSEVLNEMDVSKTQPEVETLADYDAIIQYTNSTVKSEHPIISNLKCGDIIHGVIICDGYIGGKMIVKTYTDEEFTVYHNGLKIYLTFTPEMLPKITLNNGGSEKLFKYKSSINPKFKPDILVQLIRDPEFDFKDNEEDITGLCYIEEYVDNLTGFSVTHIQKKLTGIENRPYTLAAPSRFFALNKLNKYLFKVIDVDFGKIHDK